MSIIGSNKVETVFIPSENGKLEGKILRSSRPNAPAAIIFHPDSVNGGSMNNKVVYRMFHAFGAEGFTVLRYNCRGVGRSNGAIGYSGEILDAAAAFDWLQTQTPEASDYWVGGFSRGAYVAMQMVMRRPEVGGFIVSGLPVSRFDFSFLSPCPAKGLIMHGTEDNMFAENEVYNFYRKLSKQKNIHIEYQAIEGANHFFDNQLDDIGYYSMAYLKANANTVNLAIKNKRDRKKRHHLIPKKENFS